jgi:hypothetical protein
MDGFEIGICSRLLIIVEFIQYNHDSTKDINIFRFVTVVSRPHYRVLAKDHIINLRDE